LSLHLATSKIDLPWIRGSKEGAMKKKIEKYAWGSSQDYRIKNQPRMVRCVKGSSRILLGLVLRVSVVEICQKDPLGSSEDHGIKLLLKVVANEISFIFFYSYTPSIVCLIYGHYINSHLVEGGYA
jgi:hypothetical protein